MTTQHALRWALSVSLAGGGWAGDLVAQRLHPSDYFRTVDGAGNNRRHPAWGRAGEALLRHADAAYADGRSAAAGAHRPNARAISNAIAAQTGSRPNRVGATDLVWQWGQFIDHDLDLTLAASPAELLPIAVPTGDRYFDPYGTGTVTIGMSRSAYAAGRVRQQTNSITAFLDASMVYGSDAVRAAALRAADGGLRTSAGDLLPFNTLGLDNAPDASSHYFLAGDVRANENVGLTALHVLFVREHNRLARILRRIGLEPELTYQLARAVVGAEIQAITYREFLPVLLGPNALRPYRGYRDDVDPGIANEFSTAAFRLGHSMLSPTLLRLDAGGAVIGGGHLALRDAFFAPEQIVAHGVDPLLRGLAAQACQDIDTMVIDDVRNFLFGPPGAGGFDLAALNLQRGRDHGLPSYEVLRRAMRLPEVRSRRDVPCDPVTSARLIDAYGDARDTDAWIGGLAEDHLPGAMVGPLFHRILADQFERLRDGDRFWYEAWLPRELVVYAEAQTLAMIIRANTGIGAELPDDVFRSAEARPAAFR